MTPTPRGGPWLFAPPGPFRTTPLRGRPTNDGRSNPNAASRDAAAVRGGRRLPAVARSQVPDGPHGGPGTGAKTEPFQDAPWRGAPPAANETFVGGAPRADSSRRGRRSHGRVVLARAPLPWGWFHPRMPFMGTLTVPSVMSSLRAMALLRPPSVSSDRISRSRWVSSVAVRARSSSEAGAADCFRPPPQARYLHLARDGPQEPSPG